MTNSPVLDYIQPIGGIGYGFRLNDLTYGTGPENLPTLTEAPVKGANGVTNQLYGNDSPGGPLDNIPNWVAGTWTRSDKFTVTLMYNPDPTAVAGPGADGPARSIWVPVGTLTWSWTATAGRFLNKSNQWVEIERLQPPRYVRPQHSIPHMDGGLERSKPEGRFSEVLPNFVGQSCAMDRCVLGSAPLRPNNPIRCRRSRGV